MGGEGAPVSFRVNKCVSALFFSSETRSAFKENKRAVKC